VDGDALRSGVCADLGYDDASRTENHRRAAEMARLACAQGLTVVGATMCPANHHRALLRSILGDRLRLIHVKASHEVCAQRDPKGLYSRAQQGLITGLSADIFQEPEDLEVDGVIDTNDKNPEASSADAWHTVLDYLDGSAA
jgi:adenylylsulfate kinase-like enzyme